MAVTTELMPSPLNMQVLPTPLEDVTQRQLMSAPHAIECGA